jgi:single-strand DNA-binding protein
MNAVNKVILIGNLGRAPELSYLPSGDAVVNVSLATTDSWKDRDSGDKRDRTEWHRLTFYRALAEVVGQYLSKGSRIYVEGRLTYRSWVDGDGKDLSAAEIEVERLLMLDRKDAKAGTVQVKERAARRPARAGSPVKTAGAEA